MQYEPDVIRTYFETLGSGEWDRLVATPASRASLAMHCRMLEKHITSGDHVLEIGAGPGRFTIELARLGASIVVGDLSPHQLALNATNVGRAGCEDAVHQRDTVDIVELDRYDDASFDAVIAFGGPLSYAMNRAGDAVAGMRRVVRPGGLIALSVMSLVGTTRAVLSVAVDIARTTGVDTLDRILDTGDLDGVINNGHRCHMFRWRELEALLEDHGLSVIDASASNCLSLNNDEAIAAITVAPSLWERFMEWEWAACREPGALDVGTHIIAVARRPAET